MLDALAARFKFRLPVSAVRHIYLEAIIGQFDTWREFCLGRIVIIVMSEVGEIRSLGANAPGRRQGFVQAHVSRMRIPAQRIEHDTLNTADLLDDLGRDLLAIA